MWGVSKREVMWQGKEWSREERAEFSCTMCVPDAYGGQRVSCPLDLELQVVESLR